MRSRLVPGCIAAVVASVTLASIGRAAAFRKGPYLIYPGTNTEMTVLWQADSSPSNSYVEWGVDTGYGSSSGALTETGPGADEHQFEHTIAGLAPAARYYYRVHVDANSQTGSFLAAPAASATSVTLYGFGDTRSNPQDMDKVCAQLVTDVGTSPDARQTISLHSGDWVSNGDTESDWDGQFFNRSHSNNLSFQSRMAVMGCRGNHEDTGVVLRKYYPYNYQDAAGCYYSFDYGPVHVTVIDQYVSYSSGSTQHTWVGNDLAGTSKPWKIVVLHAPPWGGGTHVNSTQTQSELCPLFETNEVVVVIAGHNHNYVRAVVNGIHYLTLGGGGAPLYAPDPGYPNVVTAEMTHHFARFEVSGGTMTVTIVRDDGTVVETFAETVVTGNVAITRQPADASVREGGTATFTVTATGAAPLSYQWQVDTGSGWGDIGGADASSYTTAIATLGDDGNKYRCVVSNTVPSSATSNAATLTVLPHTVTVTAPTGGLFFKGKQDVTITWTSTLPGDVRIEFTDDNWGASTTVVASTANSGSYVWELPNVASSDCAFRVSDATDGDPTDDSGTFSIAQITDADGDRMDDDWETTFWVDVTVSDGTGDPDGDGLTDLEEFWLGRDPTVKEQTGTRSTGCVPAGGAGGAGVAAGLALAAARLLSRSKRGAGVSPGGRRFLPAARRHA